MKQGIVLGLLLCSAVGSPTTWADDDVELEGSFEDVGDDLDLEGTVEDVELEGDYELEGVEENVAADDASARTGVTEITSSRTDKQGKATQVDVIDETALKERNARTVADALSQEAGIQLNTNRGNGQTLTIDGMDGKYVLILVDGQPVNGKVDNRTDLSRLGLSASQIKKVEVVRGPMSALYGSDAMGGVVHIITKKPRPGTHASVELFGSTAETGWFDAGGNLRLSTSVGPAQFSLDLGGLRKNAVDFGTPPDETDPWWGALDVVHPESARPDGAADLPHRMQGNVKAAAKLFVTDNWILEANVAGTFAETESVLLASAPFRDRSVDDQINMTLQSRSYFGDDKLTLQMRADHFGHRFEKVPTGELGAELPTFCIPDPVVEVPVIYEACPTAVQLKNHSILREGRAEAIYDTHFPLPFFGRINTVVGAVAAVQTATRENEDGSSGLDQRLKRIDTGALYAEFSSRPLPFLLIVPGIRVEGFSTGEEVDPFDFVVNPKISARVDLPFGLFTRAAYGSGFRRPSFLERFLYFDHSELGYVVQGNPNLRPEESQGLRIEGGWTSSWATASVEGYANFLENMIAERNTGQSTGADIPIYTYENLDSAVIAGVNVRAALKPWHGFSGEVGAQLLPIAHNTSTCDAFAVWCDDTEPLPLRAPLSLHLRGRYQLAATDTVFTAHLEGLSPRLVDVVDEAYAPASALVGFGVVQPIGDAFEVNLTAENVLGMRHATYGPKPGRTLHVTLRGKI